MSDEERIKLLVEEMVKRHDWTDEEVQRALLEVARAHIWRRGLWARLKYVVNIAGFIGALSGLVMMAAAFFGWEIVRKP